MFCKHCRYEFYVPGDSLGAKVRCPNCTATIKIEDKDLLYPCPKCGGMLNVSLWMIGAESQCPHCQEEIVLSLGENSRKYFPDSPKDTEILKTASMKNGEIIGKYRIIRCLGIGGMGEVYLAEHTVLNTRCALKLLKQDIARNDPEMRQRLLREARLASRIQHKNLIAVLDAEVDPESDSCYIVMEYVDGVSLENILTEGPMLEQRSLEIVRDVVNALIAASAEKVIHRDIKPANIMLSSSGEVKLADLGIAKVDSDSSNMTLTMDNAILGTPNYASPEQLRSSHKVDCRADIYSLGATMYHMLTGKRPFESESVFGVMAKVLEKELPPVRMLNPEISESTSRLIERMMSKDPSGRPADLQTLMRELENGVNRRSWLLAKLKKFRWGKFIWSAILLILAVSGLTVAGIIMKQNYDARKAAQAEMARKNTNRSYSNWNRMHRLPMTREQRQPLSAQQMQARQQEQARQRALLQLREQARQRALLQQREQARQRALLQQQEQARQRALLQQQEQARQQMRQSQMLYRQEREVLPVRQPSGGTSGNIKSVNLLVKLFSSGNPVDQDLIKTPEVYRQLKNSGNSAEAEKFRQDVERYFRMRYQYFIGMGNMKQAVELFDLIGNESFGFIDGLKKELLNNFIWPRFISGMKSIKPAEAMELADCILKIDPEHSQKPVLTQLAFFFDRVIRLDHLAVRDFCSKHINCNPELKGVLNRYHMAVLRCWTVTVSRAMHSSSYDREQFNRLLEYVQSIKIKLSSYHTNYRNNISKNRPVDPRMQFVWIWNSYDVFALQDLLQREPKRTLAFANKQFYRPIRIVENADIIPHDYLRQCAFLYLLAQHNVKMPPDLANAPLVYDMLSEKQKKRLVAVKDLHPETPAANSIKPISPAGTGAAVTAEKVAAKTIEIDFSKSDSIEPYRNFFSEKSLKDGLLKSDGSRKNGERNSRIKFPQLDYDHFAFSLVCRPNKDNQLIMVGGKYSRWCAVSVRDGRATLAFNNFSKRFYSQLKLVPGKWNTLALFVDIPERRVSLWVNGRNQQFVFDHDFKLHVFNASNSDEYKEFTFTNYSADRAFDGDIRYLWLHSGKVSDEQLINNRINTIKKEFDVSAAAVEKLETVELDALIAKAGEYKEKNQYEEYDKITCTIADTLWRQIKRKIDANELSELPETVKKCRKFHTSASASLWQKIYGTLHEYYVKNAVSGNNAAVAEVYQIMEKVNRRIASRLHESYREFAYEMYRGNFRRAEEKLKDDKLSAEFKGELEKILVQQQERALKMLKNDFEGFSNRWQAKYILKDMEKRGASSQLLNPLRRRASGKRKMNRELGKKMLMAGVSGGMLWRVSVALKCGANPHDKTSLNIKGREYKGSVFYLGALYALEYNFSPLRRDVLAALLMILDDGFKMNRREEEVFLKIPEVADFIIKK